MHEDQIQNAVRIAGRELARLKNKPDDTRFSELIADSLDRMRLVVSIEGSLGTSLDDERIMTLNFSSEEALVVDLRDLVAGR